jgi:serine/threonine protein phosphatase PrpC
MVSTAEDGEILDSATRTLYSATEILHGETELTNDEVLVLTTDGVSDFLMDSGKTLAVGADLAERWQRPVRIESFVSDLMFDFITADDDRTAVVCWPDRTRRRN